MEKRNLLEIVNDVATSMDYELVNTIGDTPESDQIARIIRNEYSKLMDRLDWPHLKVTTELEGLGDITQPTTMRVPDRMASIMDVRYDITAVGDIRMSTRVIDFIQDTREFLDRIYTRSTVDTTTFTTPEGIPIWVYTDRAPSFYTTFDDNRLIFDAYDMTADTTLQGSKTICSGLRGPIWTVEDNFVPAMPVNMFSMFISKCKIVANEQLRQITLSTEIRDQQISLTHLGRQRRVQKDIQKPNYGRSGNTTSRRGHRNAR